MATTIIPIPVQLGRMHTTNTPADLLTVQESNVTEWRGRLADGASQRFHYSFWLPDNLLSGSTAFRVHWRTSGTGAVVLAILAFSMADASARSDYTFSSAVVTHTVTGANEEQETVFTTSTPSSSTDGRLVMFYIERQGAAAGDTCAAAVDILGVTVEYTSDPTVTKGWCFIPASAFACPTSGGASLGSGTVINNVAPYTLNFADASEQAAFCRVPLPSSFSGALVATAVIGTTSTGNVALSLSAAGVSPGDSADEALSAGSLAAYVAPAGTLVFKHHAMTVPVSPAASEDLILKITRAGGDALDTCTSVLHLYGIVLEWNSASRNPALFDVSPQSFALPASGAAQIRRDDTNSSKWVAEFADSVTQAVDARCKLGSHYGSGGTLRVKWRSSVASGNTRWQATYASPANGVASNPALGNAVETTSACAGAGLVNEFTLALGSGFVVGDSVLFRLSRLGSDALDTLAGSVEIVSCQLEVSLA